MPKTNALPKGWAKNRPMKNVIEGTRFLPFKTPIMRSVGKLKFTAPDLLERVGNLGIVLNLSGTDRNYTVQIFKTKNVEHHHIKLIGNGRVPPREDIDRVFKVLDEFIRRNENDTNKLVGVHCTHGVNRTGYVICRYMIEKLGFEPEEAIRRFVQGRGHIFDHPALVEALQELRPSEDPLAKGWHSIGGSAQRGNRERGVRLDFTALANRIEGGGDRANIERPSTRVSTPPRIAPPRSDPLSGRNDHRSRLNDRSRERSRSPERDRGQTHQEFSREVVASGSFYRYLGPREQLRKPHWPARYVGPRREESREYY